MSPRVWRSDLCVYATSMSDLVSAHCNARIFRRVNILIWPLPCSKVLWSCLPMYASIIDLSGFYDVRLCETFCVCLFVVCCKILLSSCVRYWQYCSHLRTFYVAFRTYSNSKGIKHTAEAIEWWSIYYMNEQHDGVGYNHWLVQVTRNDELVFGSLHFGAS